MAKRKKTDIVQLKVRLREALRGQLESAAKNQERSLNSEIVARLEESFRRAELASLAENINRLSALHEQARTWLAPASGKPSLLEALASGELSDLAPRGPGNAPPPYIEAEAQPPTRPPARGLRRKGKP
jgi:hypothetical protein